MKANWKTVGLVALAAGALYYPGLKLYQYIAKRRAQAGNEGQESDKEETATKHLFSAYRGKHHTPHHRHDHMDVASANNA